MVFPLSCSIFLLALAVVNRTEQSKYTLVKHFFSVCAPSSSWKSVNGLTHKWRGRLFFLDRSGWHSRSRFGRRKKEAKKTTVFFPFNVILLVALRRQMCYTNKVTDSISAEQEEETTSSPNYFITIISITLIIMLIHVPWKKRRNWRAKEFGKCRIDETTWFFLVSFFPSLFR